MSTLPPSGESLLSFQFRFDNTIDTGILTISGLDLPENAKFSVLSKIWSSVKKRIAELYDAHITGLFFSRGNNTVVCNFIINSAEKPDYPSHLKIFRDTFPEQMEMFKDAIEKFLASRQCGEYREYVESAASDEEIAPTICDSILADFLLSTGFKTVADEKAKSEAAKKRKKHK